MKPAAFFRIIGPVCVPSLLLGLGFFAASLTPSLVPRGPLVQGILGGLVTALGYLVGRVFALLWRAADLPRLSGQLALVFKWILAIATLTLFVWMLGSSLTWQNDLRQKMGLEPADALHLWQILMLAVAVFAVAFIMGRLVATLFRLVRARFYRIMPPRRANVLGFVTIAALLFIVTRDGLFDRVVLIVASPTVTVKPGLFGTLLKAAAWSHPARRIGRLMRAGVVERETLPGGILKLR